MADEETKQIEPKPCPFCGSGKMLTCVDETVYYISCEDCGVDGPVADSKQGSKEKWNYRVVMVGDITAVGHASAT